MGFFAEEEKEASKQAFSFTFPVVMHLAAASTCVDDDAFASKVESRRKEDDGVSLDWRSINAALCGGTLACFVHIRCLHFIPTLLC